MRPKKRQQQLAALPERLRLVVQSRPQSRRTIEKFAEDIGAKRHTVVSVWLNGRTIPGGRYLERIGDLTGVSVDWLLGFDVPMYRNQSLDPAALDEQVGAHVTRELSARANREPWRLSLASYKTDGAIVLAKAVERELELIRGAWRRQKVFEGRLRQALRKSLALLNVVERGRREKDLKLLLTRVEELAWFIGAHEDSVLKRKDGKGLIWRAYQ